MELKLPYLKLRATGTVTENSPRWKVQNLEGMIGTGTRHVA
jgi:hypothetical protein